MRPDRPRVIGPVEPSISSAIQKSLPYKLQRKFKQKQKKKSDSPIMRAPTILEPEEIKKRRLMAELQAIKGITEQKRREYARKREQELKKKEEAANQQLIEKRKQNLKRLY